MSERRSEQPFPQEALAWVGRWDEEKEECLALSISSRDIMAWDCSAHLPFFVCQEQVYMPGVCVCVGGVLMCGCVCVCV